jgi:hypothetical protein
VSTHARATFISKACNGLVDTKLRARGCKSKASLFRVLWTLLCGLCSESFSAGLLKCCRPKWEGTHLTKNRSAGRQIISREQSPEQPRKLADVEVVRKDPLRHEMQERWI